MSDTPTDKDPHDIQVGAGILYCTKCGWRVRSEPVVEEKEHHSVDKSGHAG